jgi:hypothetical protein
MHEEPECLTSLYWIPIYDVSHGTVSVMAFAED